MWTTLIAVVFALPHGGQYLPPPADPDDPDAGPGVLSQPGSGPQLAFHPGRWEWWFDFHQESLLELRARMAAQLTAGGQLAYQPVTDEVRIRRVLPALVDALRSRHRDVRAAAAVALGRLRLAASVPYLEVMTDDLDFFVRVQSVLALGVSGQPAAVEPLTAILRDRRRPEETRIVAAAALGLIGGPEVRDVFTSLLTERALARANNLLRSGLVFGAGLTGDPLIAPRLVALRKTWLWRTDASIRALVAVALGHTGAPESLPLLLTLLGDRDNQVRRSAATGLAALGDQLTPSAVEALIDHFGAEGDVPVRFNLLRALGAVRRERARTFLTETFTEATALVRPHAALALALDGDGRHGEPLLEALEDQHERSLRAALVVSLGLLRSRQALEPLMTLLEREREPLLLGYLCLALGLIGVPRPELAERIDELLADSRDVELTRFGIVALGLLGERERLQALATSLEDITGTVDRAARVHALGLVGDVNTVDAVLALAADEEQPSYVVTYALTALGDICDPRPMSPTARLSHHVELNHDVSFLFELYRLL